MSGIDQQPVKITMNRAVGVEAEYRKMQGRVLQFQYSYTENFVAQAVFNQYNSDVRMRV